MERVFESVEDHYTRHGTLNAILGAIGADRRGLGLTPADLAPVDEFHIRGREATIDLARRAGLLRGQRVLDVGSGLGGSARYLASEFGCKVTGVDLTREFVEVAKELTRLVGLSGQVEHRTASALELPFDNTSFEVVWTEHVQMNIEDKERFYSELARVLERGGRLALHDFFVGPNGAPQYPVPWAADASISFLAPPHQVRGLIEAAGFEVLEWIDESELSRDWLAHKIGQPPPQLGLHLLMGPTAAVKFANVVRGLTEKRLVVCQAVARKL
jgi:ubiquinone/menaquinone biosynthesis C-methylase UbiE